MDNVENNADKILAEAIRQSNKIEEDIKINPGKYRVLTGDRPTGRLHIGHYFGSLKNRVRLSKLGVPTMILIADYQVLTDHDAFDKISQNTKQLVIDYLAAGIEPNENVIIYPHSHVPEANQLMVPFLTLVSNSELNRNPTVKDEIQKSEMSVINAGIHIQFIKQWIFYFAKEMLFLLVKISYLILKSLEQLQNDLIRNFVLTIHYFQNLTHYYQKLL